jgi:nucleotide-binding universal stress UspA family protein
MIKYPLYLVPFDFTEVSQNAADLALEIAKKNDGQVYLLNVVSDKKEKQTKRSKLQSHIEKFGDDAAYFTHNCIQGEVFDSISKSVEILRPNLVVLGTHGAKGLRKFFGSHMDKIISNSDSPLLIIQDKYSFADFSTMVMPFNRHKESLQITSFAAKMAKNFNATIHLVPNEGVNDNEAQQVATNKLNVQRFFENAGVKYETHKLAGKKSFEEELISFSKESGANLIAITYDSNHNFLGTKNVFMNHMIENNEKIPVLTYNSEELSQTYY